MKNKFLVSMFLVALAAVSFSCGQKKEEITVDKDKIKAEIQLLEDNLALIYNTRNADSMTYYADDAVSYLFGQKPLVGKAAIHQFIQDELRDFPNGAKISNETLEIYITDDGNNVAEIGAFNLVDSTGAILQRGHYFSLFAKRDGKFVCTRDMVSSGPIEN